MVAMGMGQHDGINRSAPNSLHQRIKMTFILGPRIKHSQPLLTQKEGIGACKSIGTCIGRRDAHESFCHRN